LNFKKQVHLAPFNENALAIFVGKQKIGVMGEIDLSVTEKLIKKQAYGFVIYPEKISSSSANPKILKTSKFPLSTRDINIVIDKSIAYKEGESLISQAAIKHLVSFNLINTFEGKGIPKGSVSMTLRFTFQSKTKSLLESEISSSMQMILKLLEKRLNAKIRS
jgi:phenylalanyl-tRNA synthetase beta subunit